MIYDCVFLKCCRNSPSTENGFAYGHALIYKMSPVVHHSGEADDILNTPIQILWTDIKLQPAGQTAVVSINVLPCKLAACQPIPEFLLYGPLQKVLQCKTVRIKVTILLGFLWQASSLVHKEILALALIFSERSG